MRYLIHSANFFIVALLSLLAPLAIAQKDVNWNIELTSYLSDIRFEYGYYANAYDDGSYFPETRAQEILQHIENHFLKPHAYEIFSYISFFNEKTNMLSYASSTTIAKLLLRYGAVPFYDKKTTPTPIVLVARQSGRNKNTKKNLTHNEILTIIKEKVTWDYWNNDLPSNNSIALMKLYASLGADIHAKNKHTGHTVALIESLYNYETIVEGKQNYIRPSKIHRADDIKPPEEGEYHYEGTSYYYRSKVTYWIEEFIESGYSAEMLDTHKLLYPRFMKGASVEDVKDMLDNPKAHAIKTNINCNYDKDEDETALICPLTPSINMRDAMGRTPLHIAGNEGNQAVYDYLKNMGADTSIKDYRNNLATLK